MCYLPTRASRNETGTSPNPDHFVQDFSRKELKVARREKSTWHRKNLRVLPGGNHETRIAVKVDNMSVTFFWKRTIAFDYAHISYYGRCWALTPVLVSFARIFLEIGRQKFWSVDQEALSPKHAVNNSEVSVHRPGSGSFFGGCLRVLSGTSSPKNVPDPLSLH